MRILGIAGSLRRGSHNERLLRAAADLLPPGATLERWDGLRTLPHYDADLEEALPLEVEAFRAAVDGADALLIATPEYNGSIPGVLKNAVDWASRPYPHNSLRRLPTAVIGASTGMFGAVWAQAELRKSLSLAGASVLDRELPIPLVEDALTDDCRLVEPLQAEALADLLAELVESARVPSAAAAGAPG